MTQSTACHCLPGLQGVLKGLLQFMLQLEHLAVLLASLNVKSAAKTGPTWRKRMYARVIQLLEHVRSDKDFASDIGNVSSNMWQPQPVDTARAKQAATQLGKSADLGIEDACKQLQFINLYVDTPADQTREDAGNQGYTVQDLNDAADDAEQDMSIEAEAHEDTQGVDDIADPGMMLQCAIFSGELSIAFEFPTLR